MRNRLTARDLLSILLTIPENRLDDPIFMECSPWRVGFLGRVGLGNGSRNNVVWFYGAEYSSPTGYGIMDIDVTYL